MGEFLNRVCVQMNGSQNMNSNNNNSTTICNSYKHSIFRTHVMHFMPQPTMSVVVSNGISNDWCMVKGTEIVGYAANAEIESNSINYHNFKLENRIRALEYQFTSLIEKLDSIEKRMNCKSIEYHPQISSEMELELNSPAIALKYELQKQMLQMFKKKKNMKKIGNKLIISSPFKAKKSKNAFEQELELKIRNPELKFSDSIPACLLNALICESIFNLMFLNLYTALLSIT